MKCEGCECGGEECVQRVWARLPGALRSRQGEDGCRARSAPSWALKGPAERVCPCHVPVCMHVCTCACVSMCSGVCPSGSSVQALGAQSLHLAGCGGAGWGTWVGGSFPHSSYSSACRDPGTQAPSFAPPPRPPPQDVPSSLLPASLALLPSHPPQLLQAFQRGVGFGGGQGAKRPEPCLCTASCPSEGKVAQAPEQAG